jgi:hypothetical protein
MTKGIVTTDASKSRYVKEFITEVTYAIESASVASALLGFRFARGASGEVLVHDGLNDLALAAASRDLAKVGRLFEPRDLNTISFNERELPASLVRRPLECSLSDCSVSPTCRDGS